MLCCCLTPGLQSASTKNRLDVFSPQSRAESYFGDPARTRHGTADGMTTVYLEWPRPHLVTLSDCNVMLMGPTESGGRRTKWNHSDWHGNGGVIKFYVEVLGTHETIEKCKRTLNRFIGSPLQEHDILSLVSAQTLFDLANHESYTAAARLEQNVICCWVLMWMPNFKISTMGFIIIRLPDSSLWHCVLWDSAADMLEICSWKTCFKCSAVLYCSVCLQTSPPSAELQVQHVLKQNNEHIEPPATQ